MCILTFNWIDRHVEYRKRTRPYKQSDKNFLPYCRSGWPYRPLGSHRHQAGQWRGQSCSPRSTWLQSRNGTAMADSASQRSHLFQLNRSKAGVCGLRESFPLGRVVPRRSAHIAKPTRDQDGDAQWILGLSSLLVSKSLLYATAHFPASLYMFALHRQVKLRVCYQIWLKFAHNKLKPASLRWHWLQHLGL